MTQASGGGTAVGSSRGSRWLGLTLGIGLLLASCSPTSSVEPTPYPTAAPRPTAADAAGVLRAYLTAWRLGAYERMYGLLSAADRERYPEAEFVKLYESLDSLLERTDLTWVLGTVTPTSLPPAPRPPDLPPPAATATPAPSGGPQSGVSPTPQPTTVSTPVPPDTVVAGPVPGMRASADIAYHTNRFDVIHLQRQLLLVRGADGWALRWSPDQLLPGLDINSLLSLQRIAPTRGSIMGQDGTVWAETRDDGVRVYPQEWNAGQTIGYVTPATDDELKRLEPEGYVAGDVIGRLGLEKGADALLRGRPGYQLLATNQAGASSVLLERPVVEGANLTITLRADVQRTADAQIGGYAAGAGTAVVDPKSGDVWALASAPLFNPNSMVLGSTLSGQRLSASTSAQRFNQAVLGAYPAGSSFKPFTLMAALRTGVAGPSTRMPCNGTWTFDGFTFHNYEDHTLGSSVNLLQAMAFSCNTTYMPLSIRVYDANQTALTDLIREFGFGQFTGIGHLEEESGILPDAAYFETHKRWNGVISPYGPFDQIQLAIGQGSYQGTPLQLATAYAAIGNGGTLWVPRLVVDATLPSGKVVEHNDPTVHNQINLTADQWAYVVEALKAVVNYSYGTAYSAFRGYGIQVAGKSGTAETGTPNPHAWFPAFAPANDPQIAMATVLLYIHLGTGGTDAAPLDRRIMTTYFANP
jgi:penicillin-binding protein 2